VNSKLNISIIFRPAR